KGPWRARGETFGQKVTRTTIQTKDRSTVKPLTPDVGTSRAKAILKSLTPAQRALIVDPAPHVSGLCPRRAGKSYAGAAAALITGEAKPGSISLIISLNLKQLKRIYWSGGPSGLFTLNRKFDLGLEFNKTECRWEHQNGSIGYLLGTSDPE